MKEPKYKVVFEKDGYKSYYTGESVTGLRVFWSENPALATVFNFNEADIIARSDNRPGVLTLEEVKE